MSGREVKKQTVFTSTSMYGRLPQLEEKIGYHFKNKEYLILALTHRSYANEEKSHNASRVNKHLMPGDHNERLEFLGDAVLELSSSYFLFKKYPNMSEGDMSKLRASVVCEPILAEISKEMGLVDYIFLGIGEERGGGRNRPSIISDALEAVIGAIYLDGGFESANAFILKFILNDIENKRLFLDSKTILQEIVQSKYHGKELKYVVLSESGPAHDKFYCMGATIGGKLYGEGRSHTKKDAEQKAAYETIKKLRK